jgi:hypothetical protein
MSAAPEGPTVVLTGMLTAWEGSSTCRMRRPKYASLAAIAKPPLQFHLMIVESCQHQIQHSFDSRPGRLLENTWEMEDVYIC